MVLAAPLVSAAARISATWRPAARARRRRRRRRARSCCARPVIRSRVKADAEGVRTSTRVVRGCSPAVSRSGRNARQPQRRTRWTRGPDLSSGLSCNPAKPAGIAGRDPGWTGGAEFAGLAKDELEPAGEGRPRECPSRSSPTHQELLWASDHYAVLLIFQAMDAAGKDSAIEHVMSGVNPQGVQVFSFKQPSARGARPRLPLAHARALPERGRIGIFNRSHYEEVVARVHPEWLERATASAGGRDERSGRSATRTSTPSNATSTATARRSSSSSSTSPRRSRRSGSSSGSHDGEGLEVHAADVAERAHWDDYMGAFEDALTATSTPWAPWYVIPADHKRLAQVLVGQVLAETMRSLDLHWPEVSAADHAANLEARKRLEAETG